MIGSCTVSAVGHLLGAVRVGPVRLVDGSAATRNAGRQDASMQAISRVGCRARTSLAIMSSRPLTAFTGVPSGAVMVSGTP